MCDTFTRVSFATNGPTGVTHIVIITHFIMLLNMCVLHTHAHRPVLVFLVVAQRFSSNTAVNSVVVVLLRIKCMEHTCTQLAKSPCARESK